MRTTIRMNNALAKEVKRYAQKADLTFTEVVERALCEWLAKKRSPTKPKAHIKEPETRHEWLAPFSFGVLGLVFMAIGLLLIWRRRAFAPPEAA